MGSGPENETDRNNGNPLKMSPFDGLNLRNNVVLEAANKLGQPVKKSGIPDMSNRRRYAGTLEGHAAWEEIYRHNG